jgi:hypothetical protein
VSYGDDLLRGYITIDVVASCSTEFPSSPGYFDNVAGFDNVLWGDYFYIDPQNDFAHGESLVHVEADPTGTVFQPGDYTFYGRYVGFSAVDRREPLGSTFATSFVKGGVFDGGTDLICWRDSKTDPAPFACGSLPAPFPLGQAQLVVFDEDENPELVEESNFSPAVQQGLILACPWEAGRSRVGGPDFPVGPDFGWLYLNLNTSTGSLQDPFAQAWVTTTLNADDRFSAGFDAVQLDSLCVPVETLLSGNRVERSVLPGTPGAPSIGPAAAGVER